MADLHVLEDLGQPQHGGTHGPRGLAGLLRLQARHQRDPARGGEAALDLDHPVDVRRVRVAARLLDLGTDRVELAAELLDLLLAEVGVLLDVGDGHLFS